MNSCVMIMAFNQDLFIFNCLRDDIDINKIVEHVSAFEETEQICDVSLELKWWKKYMFCVYIFVQCSLLLVIAILS